MRKPPPLLFSKLRSGSKIRFSIVLLLDEILLVLDGVIRIEYECEYRRGLSTSTNRQELQHSSMIASKILNRLNQFPQGKPAGFIVLRSMSGSDQRGILCLSWWP